MRLHMRKMQIARLQKQNMVLEAAPTGLNAAP